MKKKKGDERRYDEFNQSLCSYPYLIRHVQTKSLQSHSSNRSHGALCAITAIDMKEKVPQVLFGGGKLTQRARIQCVVKSTFSETRLVPALNDLLIANPSPGECLCGVGLQSPLMLS